MVTPEIYAGLKPDASQAFLNNKSFLNKWQMANHIKNVVAGYYKLDREDLESLSRKAEIVKPRHLAMYLIMKKTSLNSRQIAELFNRDRTSVIFAHKAIRDRIDTSRNFREELKEIEDILNSN